MCGRYATSRSSVDLSALFEATDEVPGLEADYNVAPTDPVPMVRMTSKLRAAGGAPGPDGAALDGAPLDGAAAASDAPEGGQGQLARVLSSARWGLLPHWAKDARAGARMINARSETVMTASAFASSFAKRRCLIPADGWYEWVKLSSGTKQPYYMTRKDGQVVAFAGLWSVWGPDRLLTCSIVTTAAVDDLKLVHDRMPLVLPESRWDDWLNAPADQALLAPTPADVVAGIELRPVGAAVGDVRNDGRDLTSRVSLPSLSHRDEEPVDLTLF
jgi:putative SOS response-associated peptidase YedK